MEWSSSSTQYKSISFLFYFLLLFILLILLPAITNSIYIHIKVVVVVSFFYLSVRHNIDIIKKGWQAKKKRVDEEKEK